MRTHLQSLSCLLSWYLIHSFTLSFWGCLTCAFSGRGDQSEVSLSRRTQSEAFLEEKSPELTKLQFRAPQTCPLFPTFPHQLLSHNFNQKPQWKLPIFCAEIWGLGATGEFSDFCFGCIGWVIQGWGGRSNGRKCYFGVGVAGFLGVLEGVPEAGVQLLDAFYYFAGYFGVRGEVGVVVFAVFYR